MGRSKHSKKRKRREHQLPSPQDDETPTKKQMISSFQKGIDLFQQRMYAFQRDVTAFELDVSAPKRRTPTSDRVLEELSELQEQMGIMQAQIRYIQEEREESEEDQLDEEPPESPASPPASPEGAGAAHLEASPSLSPEVTPPPPIPLELLDSPPEPPAQPERQRTPPPAPRRSLRHRKNRESPKLPDIQLDIPEFLPGAPARVPWILPGRRRNWSSADIPLQPQRQSVPDPAVAGPSSAGTNYQPNEDDSGSGSQGKGQEKQRGSKKKRRGPPRKKLKTAATATSSSAGGTRNRPEAAAAAAAAEPRPGPSSAHQEDQPVSCASSAAEPATEDTAQASATGCGSQGPKKAPRKLKTDWILRASMLPDMLSGIQPPESQAPESQDPENQPPESQPPESQPSESQPPENQPPENQPPENQPPENQPPESQLPESQPPDPAPEAPQSLTTQQQPINLVTERIRSPLDTLAEVACAMEAQMVQSEELQMESTNGAPANIESLLAQQLASALEMPTEPYDGNSLDTLAAAACSLAPEMSQLHISDTPPPRPTPTLPLASRPPSQPVSSFRRYLCAPNPAASSREPQPLSFTAFTGPTQAEHLRYNSPAQFGERSFGAEKKKPLFRSWEDTPSTSTHTDYPMGPPSEDPGWYQPTPNSPIIDVTSRMTPPTDLRMETCRQRSEARQASWPDVQMVPAEAAFSRQCQSAQMMPADAAFSGQMMLERHNFSREYASGEEPPRLPAQMTPAEANFSDEYALRSRSPVLALQMKPAKITFSGEYVPQTRSPPLPAEIMPEEAAFSGGYASQQPSPVFHHYSQRWRQQPDFATVYGDPRQMPQVVEVMAGSPQVQEPRPAHQLRLSHIDMKYSAPQQPPPPYITPVGAPLDHGGHQRDNNDLIRTADRATVDIAASVDIFLAVRQDPLLNGGGHHHRSQARNRSGQAACNELPLNLSHRRRDFYQLPGRVSQPQDGMAAASAGPLHMMMGIPQPTQTERAQSLEVPPQVEGAVLHNYMSNQPIADVSQLPAQHVKTIYWAPPSASPVLSRHGEVVTWPTAGPSYAPSRVIVPHSTANKSQIPSQHAERVPWSIAGSSQVPTPHVGASWPIAGTSQVTSQLKQEESWPITDRSQSRTETVITPRGIEIQESGHPQQTNKKLLPEWPTEEDFPPPNLSESSDDSSSSSDSVNFHRRKQDKCKIVHQSNDF